MVQAGASAEPSVRGVCNKVQETCSSWGENSNPQTEHSVQGSRQEAREGAGTQTWEAGRVKDAQQRCQAEEVGVEAPLHHGLVMIADGREQGEESVQSDPAGRVEGLSARVGHTATFSFPCALVTDGNGAHEGVRCDSMGTCHDNA